MRHEGELEDSGEVRCVIGKCQLEVAEVRRLRFPSEPGMRTSEGQHMVDVLVVEPEHKSGEGMRPWKI